MSIFETVRRSLRRREDSAGPVVRAMIGALRSLVRSARTAKTFLSDRDYRAVTLLKAFSGRRLHQTTVVTAMDRYPEIFGACREYFRGREDLSILSFGCATGEEVVTLRGYFPSARIVGVEINPRSLAVCRARGTDDNIRFIGSNTDSMAREGPFDVVFCMAVLQRTPHAIEAQRVADLSRIYPFEKFDEQLSSLDRLLDAGGLLVVHNTQYRVADATVAPHYRPLTPQPEPVCTGPRFDRNGRLIEGEVATPSVFVKSPLT